MKGTDLFKGYSRCESVEVSVVIMRSPYNENVLLQNRLLEPERSIISSVDRILAHCHRRIHGCSGLTCMGCQEDVGSAILLGGVDLSLRVGDGGTAGG